MKNNMSTLDRAFIERRLNEQLLNISKNFGSRAKITLVVRNTGLDKDELVCGNDDLTQVAEAVINTIKDQNDLQE